MGRATANEMARCGARIALLGRRIDSIESTAKVIRDAGSVAFAVSADIREPDLVERAMQEIEAEFGGSISPSIIFLQHSFFCPRRSVNSSPARTGTSMAARR